MGDTQVVIPYAPRPLQAAMHAELDTHRFSVSVCHRRFGKTVLAVNQLLKCALTSDKPRPRYAYIAPTFTQGKSIAWDYLTHYSRPVPGMSPNVSELRVDFTHNDSQVRIYGADNPDRLRGLYLDGVVLDEYGLMPPRIFSEVVRPALSDRQGWALFIGTPNGKNQFYELIHGDSKKEWRGAKHEPGWFFSEYKASETGILPEAELASARVSMTDDEYEQEYECSFEASVRGAIYAKEMAAVRADGRVCAVPYDPALPVDTDWDLGVGDAMCIWFSQSARGSGQVRLIDYHEASGEGFPYYANILTQKGYVYGKHWAPHDIAVRELGSGKSRLEMAASFGLRFEVTPRIHGVAGHEVEEGIHTTRLFLSRCWFDQTKCKAGVEALMHYRRDYNQRLNEFKAAPVHDWACVTGDTKVLTRSGMHQIQYLPESGEVLTPCGWKAYENPHKTRSDAPLVAVTFSDGYTVRCTPDHLFLTDSGWTFASDLATGTQIQSCWTRLLNTSTAGFIDSGRRSGITREGVSAFIVRCGSRLSERFRRAVTFITEITTPQTIGSPIWNVRQLQSICRETGIAPSQARTSTSQRARDRRLLSGIGLTPADSGISATPSGLRDGRNGSASRSPVSTVERLSRLWFGLATLKNTVLRRVRPLRIASVTALPETADVWCLTVPDGHMWPLENGAIVHNSHGADAFRGLAVRYQVPKDAMSSGPGRLNAAELSWMV